MTSRETSLDFMKMLLVIQMIIAHIIQFFSAGAKTEIFSQYANLSTFSGFMFVFGYVGHRAYFCKKDKAFKRLLKGAAKSLVAFYVSGVAITFFIYGNLTKQIFFEILTFKRIQGYSEFLLSYICVYLLMIILKILHYNTKMLNGYLTCILVLISLGLTFGDYHIITNNILGSVIGTYNYYSFPIVQYMSYFLIGVYLSKNKRVFDPLIMACSIGGTGMFLRYQKMNKMLPERFPPSIYWIIGGWFIVYGYFLLSKLICDKLKIKVPDILLSIGRNTLIFLVASNIVIFAFRYYFGIWYDTNCYGTASIITVYSVVMVCCLLVSYSMCLVKKICKARWKKENDE